MTSAVPRGCAIAALAFALASSAGAQAPAPPHELASPTRAGAPARAHAEVMDAIAREAAEGSQVVPLARGLMDGVGPRLTGSPGERAARDWALATLRGWGLQAHDEAYGTWTSWSRGVTHVDMVEPRVRSLSATLLAWSPGTEGAVQGAAVLLPDSAGPAEFDRWLADAKGKWVLVSPPAASCRPEESWTRWAGDAGAAAATAERVRADSAWQRRIAGTGSTARMLPMRLEQAGVAGVLGSRWSGGWGTEQVHNTWTLRVPMLDVACEDYGLLARLAEGGTAPIVRVDAAAKFGGEVPVHNTIAVLPGTDRAAESVVLSAHLDSWDAASGATDNGAGVVAAMEAMRILSRVTPHPRRNIVLALWGGEEEGLNGSGAYAADHPDVVRGLQALFNLDGGTGRVMHVAAPAGSESAVRGWLGSLSPQIAGGTDVESTAPGTRAESDHGSFTCRGAPAFNLVSGDWDYRAYTWHTDRDTYDKLSIADLRANAALLAGLAYAAAQDPHRTPRTPAAADACRKPSRSMLEFLEHLMAP
ncbi:MAG TPA: M20/M25/M40 family metallo-hydrolase [Longimicrobiaceae bacterium]|nr:M20/M25/M40 family metallo-hydrolase [Longimicrobiaceae bacterium]